VTAPAEKDRESGFALAVTLMLLALLVLAVYALSTLVRIDRQVSATAADRAQARQNALLGLAVGLSDLQRYAGADTRITGMAGITGLEGGSAGTMRQWCGVWNPDGSLVAWLVSGARPGASPALAGEAIELIAEGSVGAGAVDSEHVVAGKVPIIVPETAATPGGATTIGSYAYLVIDEGVKISAYAPGAERPPAAAVVPALPPDPSALAGLRAAVEAYAIKLPDVISYEQLGLLPVPSAGALTLSAMRAGFHQVTLTARTVSASENRSYAGMVNLNTTSKLVWRSILEAYNSAPVETPVPEEDISVIAGEIAAGISGADTDKAAGAPFGSVAAFGASALLSGCFPATPTPEDVMTVLAPILTVRSDTFRLRAYGEAVNPVRGARIAATAYCEAIVQRTPDRAPPGLGRKFVIVFFRWLGPTDI
jgi:Tfp pilus assembly protein PilX